MDERVRFVARLLDGEKMAPLCRAFGISRKTGYKIFSRYKEMGIEGLTDRSRRPYRHANQLPFQIETLIVSLKKEQPSWGAPKIREKLMRLYPDLHAPARFFSLPNQDGTIAPGQRADIVLLDDNPLESLATLRAPRAVVVGGTVLDRAELDRMTDELLAAAE